MVAGKTGAADMRPPAQPKSQVQESRPPNAASTSARRYADVDLFIITESTNGPVGLDEALKLRTTGLVLPMRTLKDCAADCSVLEFVAITVICCTKGDAAVRFFIKTISFFGIAPFVSGSRY
jgi:hypothetical protein